MRSKSAQSPCPHLTIDVVNRHEIVRKYQCADCQLVMMCACEEEYGTRFLPHQMAFTTDERTRLRIPVTGGFVRGLCAACRGEPEISARRAELHGATSKVRRYYWRELHMETTRRYADWCDSIGEKRDLSKQHHRDRRESIARGVVEELRRQHEIAPKYVYDEPSSADVLAEAEVPIVTLDGTYIRGAGKDRPLLIGGRRVSPEELAGEHFEQLGYASLRLESRPLHALFGIMMWLWVQDPADPRGRISGFGGREGLGADAKGLVFTILPEDFGSVAFAERRSESLSEHIASLPDDLAELLWTFDYWIEHSRNLCGYLWAHESEVVSRARRFVEVVGSAATKSILRFLAKNYWGHYLGWPDLLVWRDGEWFFAEVKSSGDRLSDVQKRWLLRTSTSLASMRGWSRSTAQESLTPRSRVVASIVEGTMIAA